MGFNSGFKGLIPYLCNDISRVLKKQDDVRDIFLKKCFFCEEVNTEFLWGLFSNVVGTSVDVEWDCRSVI